MSRVLHLSHQQHVDNDDSKSYFPQKRWSSVMVIADQLRQNTKAKQNEQIRQHAFDIPLTGGQNAVSMISVETLIETINVFQNELSSTTAGHTTLDALTRMFLELKCAFNRMFECDSDNIEQVILATCITKIALLIVLRTTESVVEGVTKGTRYFPTMNSLISFIRSHHTEFPIHGGLLVDWYKASQTLDLLLNDPDWLVQPPKAHWAIHVCNDTLAWARVVFNERYQATSSGRPIFDRDDSLILSEAIGQE